MEEEKDTDLKTKQEQFLIILEKCYGNVTMATKKGNIARSTFYKWKNEHKDIEVNE